MNRVARIAALALALGFLAATLASATLIPSLCCGTPCDNCPIVSCKDTAAVLSTKGDEAAIAPPAPALIAGVSPFQAIVASVPLARPAPSPGFQRPLRN